MSSKGISMEGKKFEIVKKWSEPKLIWDIQVLLGFANFYWQFIQGFSKIAASLTLMLKTTMSSQMLDANKVLTADEIGGIEDGDKLIKKYG